MTAPMDAILAGIAARAAAARAYLAADDFLDRITPPSLREAASAYLQRGGKGLRPAVVLLACGAAGGREEWALAAAAAAEVTHNWTLIHDDVLDRDEQRRGAPTVHAWGAAQAEEVGLAPAEARHYGVALAILGGDVGPSWAAHLLARLPENGVTSAADAFALATSLAATTVPAILTGEAEDVELSRAPLDDVTLERVEGMLARKTGALYAWCAAAGATLAGASYDIILKLKEFALLCGTAFQHVDDTLPFVSDEARLGKPAASDLREGKRTAVILGAWARASAPERVFIARTLGRGDAPPAELAELKELLCRRGGVAFARARAGEYYERAQGILAAAPPGEARELLAGWAEYMLTRDR
jgi:geranylgeranyl diphosphate synthase type I